MKEKKGKRPYKTRLEEFFRERGSQNTYSGDVIWAEFQVMKGHKRAKGSAFPAKVIASTKVLRQ